MHRQGITGDQDVAVRILVRSAHGDIGTLAMTLTCCVTPAQGT